MLFIAYWVEKSNHSSGTPEYVLLKEHFACGEAGLVSVWCAAVCWALHVLMKHFKTFFFCILGSLL